MGLYSGGLTTGRIFASENWGAYFQESLFFWGGGLLSEFYGIIITNYSFVHKMLPSDQ